MDDDEIDEMIHTMKRAGVSEAQVMRAMDVLGRVEEFGAEISSRLPPSEKRRVKEAVTAAICRMFSGDFGQSPAGRPRG